MQQLNLNRQYSMTRFKGLNNHGELCNYIISKSNKEPISDNYDSVKTEI